MDNWDDSTLLETALRPPGPDDTAGAFAALPDHEAGALKQDLCSPTTPPPLEVASRRPKEGRPRPSKLLLRRASGADDDTIPEEKQCDWWRRHILDVCADRRELLEQHRGFRMESFCTGTFAEGFVAKAT